MSEVEVRIEWSGDDDAAQSIIDIHLDQLMEHLCLEGVNNVSVTAIYRLLMGQ